MPGPLELATLCKYYRSTCYCGKLEDHGVFKSGSTMRGYDTAKRFCRVHKTLVVERDVEMPLPLPTLAETNVRFITLSNRRHEVTILRILLRTEICYEGRGEFGVDTRSVYAVIYERF